MPDHSLELKTSSTTSHSHYQIKFNAMASPCEVLLKTQDKKLCRKLATLITTEVQRIESKYSRFQETSLLSKINHSNGNSVQIDIETFQLLTYANEVYNLSDQLFDITSGILGKLWSFKNQIYIPSEQKIKKLLPSIGFNKVQYSKNIISLPRGMQLDFGGIGKEYAVDQVVKMLDSFCKTKRINFLVNLGGDLFAKNYLNEADSVPWKVGLENSKDGYIDLLNGAVATSGTSQRSFMQNGKTYSHLLNPKTGWPIENPPKSITCFAETCVLAGTYSSLAMLQGSNAESFLKSEDIDHILVR